MPRFIGVESLVVALELGIGETGKCRRKLSVQLDRALEMLRRRFIVGTVEPVQVYYSQVIVPPKHQDLRWNM